jgi:hypothetical protein
MRKILTDARSQLDLSRSVELLSAPLGSRTGRDAEEACQTITLAEYKAARAEEVGS